jgi:hypothetical protein
MIKQRQQQKKTTNSSISLTSIKLENPILTSTTSNQQQQPFSHFYGV